MSAQRFEVRPSRPAHRNIGVQTGAQHAGQERDIAAVAIARVAPGGEDQTILDTPAGEGGVWDREVRATNDETVSSICGGGGGG